MISALICYFKGHKWKRPDTAWANFGGITTPTDWHFYYCSRCRKSKIIPKDDAP